LVLIKVIFRITTVSVFLSFLDSHTHVQQHGLATDFSVFASQVSSIGNTVFLHLVLLGVWMKRDTTRAFVANPLSICTEE